MMKLDWEEELGNIASAIVKKDNINEAGKKHVICGRVTPV